MAGTHVQKREIKIVEWVFVSILMTLTVLGYATKCDLHPSSSAEANAKPVSAVAANPIDPLLAKSSRPSPATSLSEVPTPGPKCPLGRLALVRGSDSEASEGGGFFAARKNGIHGAVDLNGSLGEAVFAVADGKVITAGDWGKLGNTVIVDHLDRGYTIYGHLHTVDVKLNSAVTAGQMVGTMGYSGNARALQAKDLPPHLHFAYVRGLSPLMRVRDSGDGLGAPGATGVLDPTWAVGFQKCWDEPVLAKRASVRPR